MTSLGLLFSKDFKKSIYDIKLKWLQIRTVHRILATNVVLMKMGIVNCSKCTFCEDNKDSIDHIFWECHCIKRFWQILETLSKLNAKCNITFQAGITSNLVLFGLDSDNSVILFAKHYIYQCKRNMSLPRVDIFQKQLQLRYKVEEYNAKILSRDTFILYKSWCNYEALFSE